MKTFDERRKSVSEYMDKIQRKRRKTIAAVTSITLVVSILALVLFVPYDTTPPDVSMHSDSEYYDIIQRVNEATYQKPKYKNNFQALGAAVSSLRFIGFGGMAPNKDAIMEAPNAAPEADYVEVTDNQVAGVTESDIIKRSDKYIYYLTGDYLYIYEIAQADTMLVGTYCASQCTFPEGWEQDGFGYTATDPEMYLSEDCSTVTVLMGSYQEEIGSCVLVVNLDVRDPANVQTIDYQYFTGSMVSSRMVDGDILLTYNYRVDATGVDFSDTDTFVPRYGKPESMTTIPAEDIVCPENVSDARYTVICKLDGKTLEVEGSTALLSYSEDLYVSADTIYATHSYTEKSEMALDGTYTQIAKTEIAGISYAGETLEILGTVLLDGTVKDQYSMDQFDGILRVVTTTSRQNRQEFVSGDFVGVNTAALEQNVNLYCVDLSGWEITASVIGFAPAGEEATSVRFDGPYAYVCTAEIITFSDPVYFFDLSDLKNITWKDTGTIDGYSTSLINLGEGFLLGIGYGDGWVLKIEVYEETEDGVVSVCAYELAADFSEEYKSYLVDREKNLIGLGIWTDAHEYEYLLLHFDGYALNEITRVPMEDGNYLETMRGVLVDGWLYVCAANQYHIAVQKVW